MASRDEGDKDERYGDPTENAHGFDGRGTEHQAIDVPLPATMKSGGTDLDRGLPFGMSMDGNILPAATLDTIDLGRSVKTKSQSERPRDYRSKKSDSKADMLAGFFQTTDGNSDIRPKCSDHLEGKVSSSSGKDTNFSHENKSPDESARHEIHRLGRQISRYPISTRTDSSRPGPGPDARARKGLKRDVNFDKDDSRFIITKDSEPLYDYLQTKIDNIFVRYGLGNVPNLEKDFDKTDGTVDSHL